MLWKRVAKFESAAFHAEMYLRQGQSRGNRKKGEDRVAGNERPDHGRRSKNKRRRMKRRENEKEEEELRNRSIEAGKLISRSLSIEGKIEKYR